MNKSILFLATITILLIITGCKENSGGALSDAGIAQVEITTSGNDKWSAPYQLLVDESNEVEVVRPDEISGDVWNENLSLELERGSHEIELSGLAPNCTVEGENPVTIFIEADQTTGVEFAVVCRTALNNKVVFVSDRDGPLELYVADPGERGEGFINYERLTNDDYQERNPAISSDGTKIVYEQSGNIWVINADGTNPTQLTKSGLDREPTWFHNNTKIAFISDRDAISQLYVMNADGSGQTRLATEQVASKAQDKTSPKIVMAKKYKMNKNDEDKSTPKLILTLGGGDDGEIVILDLDDDGDGITDMIPLTDNNHFDGYPSVSPDGEEILIVIEDEQGTRNFRLIDAETGEPLATTNFEPGFIDDDVCPGWSPDGTEILFTSVNQTNAKVPGLSVMAKDFNSSRSNKPSTGIDIDTDITDFNVMHAVWGPAW